MPRPPRGALEVDRELLGERHRESIRDLNDLALVLQAKGDRAAARPLLEDAWRLGREVLGERHPLAITALNNLGVFFHGQGDLAAARPLFELRAAAAPRGAGRGAIRRRSRA